MLLDFPMAQNTQGKLRHPQLLYCAPSRSESSCVYSPTRLEVQQCRHPQKLKAVREELISFVVESSSTRIYTLLSIHCMFKTRDAAFKNTAVFRSAYWAAFKTVTNTKPNVAIISDRFYFVTTILVPSHQQRYVLKLFVFAVFLVNPLTGSIVCYHTIRMWKKHRAGHVLATQHGSKQLLTHKEQYTQGEETA